MKIVAFAETDASSKLLECGQRLNEQSQRFWKRWTRATKITAHVAMRVANFAESYANSVTVAAFVILHLVKREPLPQPRDYFFVG